jgi:TonB-dependent starch-binding outer membrane protein SusC
VSQVNASDFERVPATSPLMSLQGRSAGLRIVPGSGEPGASASIRIRGEQSISGTNSPIFVVDGVITTNIDHINSDDIESVSVLKDASVVAIYGARAANGVILVTTKRGEANKEPVISFHSYQGVQQQSNLRIQLLNAGQWLELWTEAYENAGIARPWSEEDVLAYQGVDTDWLGSIMQTGYLSNYNLSVSGGSERSNYFISTAYQNNQGMVKGMSYDRFNIRLNTDHNIRNRVRFGNSLNIYSSGQDASVDQYLRALQKIPLTRLYEDDGSWGKIRNTTLEHMHANPLWKIENESNRNENKGLMGNLYLTLNLFDGLDFTARGNLEWNNDYRASFMGGTDPAFLWEGSTINNVGKDNRETFHWITDYILNFNRSFGEVHNLTALAGYSREEQTFERLEANRNGTPNNSIRFLSAGDPDTQRNLNTYSDWAFVSMFGRAGYTYDNKYILSATVRRDGTSRLHGENKFGIFPSVAVAWRIAEESFMDPIQWLNELKVRASWGETGNVLSISPYGTKSSLTSLNFAFNQSPSQGYGMSSAVNTDLSWESTEKKNLGLDLTVFNNSTYVVADFYIEDTRDLLFTQPIPGSTGLTGSPYINAGHIRNTGIELETGFRKRSGDWYYSISANLHHFKNEVIDLGGRDLRTSGIVEGYPLRSYFGYKSNGLIRTQDDLEGNPHYGNKTIGDIWLVDVDGPDDEGKLTGNPDGIVNASDRTILDGRYPNLIYGGMGTIGYKNWTLQVQIQGIQGVMKDIRGGLNMGVLNYFVNFAQNHDILLLDRFHATKNPDGSYPRVNKADTGNNVGLFSDFWLQDASYLRIDNLNLNYDIPAALSQKMGLSKLSAYISIQNLYTFTSFYGPEVDSNADVLTGVPQPRTWTMGLQVAF